MVEYRHFHSICFLLPGIIVALSATLCLFTPCVQGQGILPWPTETSPNPTTSISDEAVVQFRMQGAKPTTDNATVCTGFRLRDTSDFWIIQIAGVASWSTVHHLGLYGCSDVITTGSACSCPMAKRSHIYAWSRNTNAIRFVGSSVAGGFRVGGTTDNQLLFIETHYHSALSVADYASGIDIHITRIGTNVLDLMIYSIMSKGTITSNTYHVYLDACVTVPDIAANTAAGQAYMGHQAHSHNLGRLVSAFSESLDKTKSGEIGRGNPMWPQVYRPSAFTINEGGDPNNYLLPGDHIYSRCYYTSTGVPFNVSTIGIKPKTTWTEMCMSNVILIASNSGQQFVTKNALLTGSCTPEQSDYITTTWPQSTTLLPPNPELDSAAINGGNTGVVTVSQNPFYEVNLGLEGFSNYI